MPADPAGVGRPGRGHGGLAARYHDFHQAGGETQFHQHRAAGVLAGVGDQFADHHLGKVPDAVGHDQGVVGVGLVEERDGVVAGVGDAAVISAQGVASSTAS
ncbi:hypothetical protein ACFZAD_39270 [Streptomyces iakyrus]|uniref:hypothetical protein n=1 Tax=Streptomyces iakyrus TaxID=68219 RepID=UPI0036E115A8